MASMETLGVYVQIPFCASKCSFCNFSSRVERLPIFDTYLGALWREIAGLPEAYLTRGISRDLLGFSVDTVYFGGGTPTLLGPERLGELVQALRKCFRIGTQVEFTVECTPGSAERALLEHLRRWGVNRLSVGAQSFDDRELRAVGRLDSASDTQEMVREARAAGFENLSLDLIAGLPYQSEESWRRNLETTARLRPEHVSLYIFEIDEKSRLGREVLGEGARYHAGALPDEAFMADAYETGREFLAGEGYAQYEISNFALAGCESRHNLKYWQLAPYVGLGAGAHSFDGVHRWSNVLESERYLQALSTGESAISDVQTLSPRQRLEEYFFLGLRQREGVDLGEARAFGDGELPPKWQESIADLSRQGLLEQVGGRVRLTRGAYLVSNEIFQEFVGV